MSMSGSRSKLSVSQPKIPFFLSLTSALIKSFLGPVIDTTQQTKPWMDESLSPLMNGCDIRNAKKSSPTG